MNTQEKLDFSSQFSLIKCLNDKNYSDLFVSCNLKKWNLHKVIVCSASSFFRKLLKSHNDKGVYVNLTGKDQQSLETIFNFIYSGHIELNFKNVAKILSTSCFLEMESLTLACCDYLIDQLNILNVISVRHFVTQNIHINEGIFKKLLTRINYFIFFNFSSIIKFKYHLRMDYISFLFFMNLCCSRPAKT